MSPNEPIPFQIAGETTWALLAEAANDVFHPMRLMTLATVDADGRPQARIMALRGADRSNGVASGGGRVWFHTDRHSRKVQQLRRHPFASATAWHANLGLQLRLIGDVRLHRDNGVAEDHWQQVNMALRGSYGEPEAGQQLPFHDPRLQTLWQHQDRSQLSADHDRFMVIELRVDRIEWLQVIGEKQWSTCLRASDDWAARPFEAHAFER